MTIKDHNAQKARRLEHGFVWFIVTLVVLVNLLVIVPSASAAECTNADTAACEDLIGAEVTFEKLNSRTFDKICNPAADACATLNVRRKTCTIYYKVRMPSSAVVEHELNHCRGWFHRGDNKRAHAKPWVDYKTFTKG